MVQESAIQEELMTTRTTLSQIAFLLLFALCSLSAQKLTARDAFWSSTDLIRLTPNPAAPNLADPNPHTQKPGEHDLRSHDGQFVSKNGYGSAPQIVPSAKPRLGLRCSVL